MLDRNNDPTRKLDYGRWKTYSLDQDIVDKECFTMIEPLQEDGWYFYEDK